MIYYIRNKQCSTVKIGYTNDRLDQRLTSIQVGNHHDLDIMATREGCRDFEKFLHRKFKKYYIRGEWFELNECIANSITDNYDEEFKTFLENNKQVPMTIFDKLGVGKFVSFKNIVERYYMLKDEQVDDIIDNKIKQLESKHPILIKAYIFMTLTDIKKYSFDESSLIKKLSKIPDALIDERVINKLTQLLDDGVYITSDLKELIEAAYISFDYEDTAKISHLSYLYDIKRTSKRINGKSLKAYKIINKLKRK